ncbi:hypothetical protein FHS43_005807 [Streptosporangium becharense]|uniref:Alpha amylase inhibitor n=1 Tax=Streptosporangium becharense TaxID=1816182 RepID=A0A7W9IMY8_9ACTN|nr:hypothetical protein [Streptosporangium becharense]MBB2914495.1 hypothetical protein [Streptosporangium becharense]MBB5823340.1 hypothetical protein [Streptosporangium becharense]
MRKKMVLASLAAALSIVSAAPATAAIADFTPAPDTTATDAAFAGTAPACITRDVKSGQVELYNSCSTAMSVRVILDWAPDSDCIHLKRHERFFYNWTIGTYMRVEVC